MSSSVANLRLDHIPVLEGQINYLQWACQMKSTLMGEELWRYVSDGTDPKRRLHVGILAPSLSANPTKEEYEALDRYESSSARAAAIILRKVSPIVMMSIPSSMEEDGRAVWTHLRRQYDHTDVSAQFSILKRLEKIQLKDASDAPRFLGEFGEGFERLTNAGMSMTEDQRIYLLLKGLPDTGHWGALKYSIENQMSEAKDAQKPMSYSKVAEKINQSAIRQVGFQGYDPSTGIRICERDEGDERFEKEGIGIDLQYMQQAWS